MTRKEKLEKALAFDEFAGMKNDYVEGRQFENRRLKPLHAALIEAVAALEAIQWSWDNDAGRQCSNITEEALAKIDKALDQQTKNSNS